MTELQKAIKELKDNKIKQADLLMELDGLKSELNSVVFRLEMALRLDDCSAARKQVISLKELTSE